MDEQDRHIRIRLLVHIRTSAHDNSAIVDSRLRPPGPILCPGESNPCCPLASHFERTSYLRRPHHRAHYGKIWRHTLNRKYISCIAIPSVKERARSVRNICRKFGKVWMCGSGDMFADRPTERLITILHCLPGETTERDFRPTDIDCAEKN